MRCRPWTSDNQEPMSCYLENKRRGKTLGDTAEFLREPHFPQWADLQGKKKMGNVHKHLVPQVLSAEVSLPGQWLLKRLPVCRVPLRFYPSREAQTLFLTNTYFFGIFFPILLAASDCEHFYVLVCYMKLIEALNDRIKENVENSLFPLELSKDFIGQKNPYEKLLQLKFIILVFLKDAVCV